MKNCCFLTLTDYACFNKNIYVKTGSIHVCMFSGILQFCYKMCETKEYKKRLQIKEIIEIYKWRSCCQQLQIYLLEFDSEFYYSTIWLDFWNPSYLTVQIFLNNLYNYLFNFAVLWSINPNCLYIISYTKHFLVVYTLKRLSLCPNWKVYKPVSAESFISVCQLDN